MMFLLNMLQPLRSLGPVWALMDPSGHDVFVEDVVAPEVVVHGTTALICSRNISEMHETFALLWQTMQLAWIKVSRELRTAT